MTPAHLRRLTRLLSLTAPLLVASPGAYGHANVRAAHPPSPHPESWSLAVTEGEASRDSSATTVTCVVSGEDVVCESSYDGPEPPPVGSESPRTAKLGDLKAIHALLRKAEAAPGYDTKPPLLRDTRYGRACLRRGSASRCATRIGARRGTAAFERLEELMRALSAAAFASAPSAPPDLPR